MKNLKWFWRINYSTTIISIIFTFLLSIVSRVDKFPIIEKIYYFVSINEKISPLLLIVEWIQIPMVLGILILIKQERTKIQWFYLISLVFLTLTKLILYFVAALGFAKGEA